MNSLTSAQTTNIPIQQNDENGILPLIASLNDDDQDFGMLMSLSSLEGILGMTSNQTVALITLVVMFRNRTLPLASEVIMSRGIDLSASFMSDTILMVCIREGYEEGIEFLLSFGVDINQAVEYGSLHFSPLMMAILSNQLKIMNLLIFNGANVNYQEPLDGLTPLIIATMKHNIAAVELLLTHYADPMQKDAKNTSAYEMAAMSGHVQLMHILKEAEKNYNNVCTF